MHPTISLFMATRNKKTRRMTILLGVQTVVLLHQHLIIIYKNLFYVKKRFCNFHPCHYRKVSGTNHHTPQDGTLLDAGGFRPGWGCGFLPHSQRDHPLFISSSLFTSLFTSLVTPLFSYLYIAIITMLIYYL